MDFNPPKRDSFVQSFGAVEGRVTSVISEVVENDEKNGLTPRSIPPSGLPQSLIKPYSDIVVRELDGAKYMSAPSAVGGDDALCN